MRYAIGDIVISKAVGVKPSFQGRVTDLVGLQYIVEDEAGKQWHRKATELRAPSAKPRKAA